jgi:hypothetical protein
MSLSRARGSAAHGPGRQVPEEIPFQTLLEQEREAHRRDLDVGGDDA